MWHCMREKSIDCMQNVLKMAQGIGDSTIVEGVHAGLKRVAEEIEKSRMKSTEESGGTTTTKMMMKMKMMKKTNMERQSVGLMVALYVMKILDYLLFAFLDVFDQLLCPVFGFLDSMLESDPAVCYCNQRRVRSESFGKIGEVEEAGGVCDDGELHSDDWLKCTSASIDGTRRRQDSPSSHLIRSLSGRSSFSVNDVNELKAKDFREKKFSKSDSEFSVRGKHVLSKRAIRWSDCSCERCRFWVAKGSHLHVVIDDKDFVGSGLDPSVNNVIFLHGFLSSSNFWMETLIPNLPASLRSKNRIIAVDLLGFGKSPKPYDCQYTTGDHLDMLRYSVLQRYGIKEFHLVAHSMGCLIALGWGAQNPSAVKSITLLAPPYFAVEPGAIPTQQMEFFESIAPRSIFPLSRIVTAIMSWYEHVGRLICILVTKGHRIYEPIARFWIERNFSRLRIPGSLILDLAQHTHHAAWHIFHNTICSAAYSTDFSLKVLKEAGQRVRVIHGMNDKTCPFQGAVNMAKRHKNVLLTGVPRTGHAGIVLRRTELIAHELNLEITLGNTRKRIIRRSISLV